jgi:hypothetical protein
VNRITRLLPDGSIDLTFNTGLGADAIEAIVLQPDGKIVLGAVSQPLILIHLIE